jgi:hypothetical protein
MANPKREELADILRYGPTRFPIYDPGPPWWFDVVSKEVQLEVVASQLQLEKEILAAQAKALDRQIALLSRSQKS